MGTTNSDGEIMTPQGDSDLPMVVIGGPQFSFGVVRNTKGFNWSISVTGVSDEATATRLRILALDQVKLAIGSYDSFGHTPEPVAFKGGGL